MRRGVISAVILAGALAAFAAACGGPADELVGEWRGAEPRNEGTAFVFLEDGSAIWALPDTFRLRYEVDASRTPYALDISGFEGGPLEGMVLYCVFMFVQDRLRLDCEPAPPGQEALRPSTFGAGTQVFERAE